MCCEESDAVDFFGWVFVLVVTLVVAVALVLTFVGVTVGVVLVLVDVLVDFGDVGVTFAGALKGEAKG